MYFGVKYFSKNDALHLVNAVKSQYQCTVNWTGSLYCGLNLDWHYNRGFFNVTMKDYVSEPLPNSNMFPTKNHRSPLIPGTHQSLTVKRPKN